MGVTVVLELAPPVGVEARAEAADREEDRASLEDGGAIPLPLAPVPAAMVALEFAVVAAPPPPPPPPEYDDDDDCDDANKLDNAGAALVALASAMADEPMPAASLLRMRAEFATAIATTADDGDDDDDNDDDNDCAFADASAGVRRTGFVVDTEDDEAAPTSPAPLSPPAPLTPFVSAAPSRLCSSFNENTASQSTPPTPKSA